MTPSPDPETQIIQFIYAEHSAILLAIIHRDVKEASDRLNAHIAQSQKEVRNITLHMLQQARQAKCP